jgi:hypothetical protein
LTIVPVGNQNLFSVDSKTLTVRRIPVGVWFEEIYAGEGQLWGLDAGLPDDRLSLLAVDPSTKQIATRETLASCEFPSGVVRLGRLWLLCDGELVAYSLGGRSERVRAPRSSIVLASSHAVWVISRESPLLVGVAGDGSGRKIPLRGASTAVQWQADGGEAWAVDASSPGNSGLFRVDLASGLVSRFDLETEGKSIENFALTSRDIWVALANAPQILRFARAHPRRPLARIDLSDEAQSDDYQTFLTSGPSYLWIALFSNREFGLFRAAAGALTK